MALKSGPANGEKPVRVEAGGVELEGDLAVPEGARALVLFAHGSGSGRKSLRNRFVARRFFEGGLATLLFDLLTPPEASLCRLNGKLRCDLDLLAQRLAQATEWARGRPETAPLRLGYFGSSSGAAAALLAAASAGNEVGAVVSRGGRPDLAGEALARVEAPTLLIVGGEDRKCLALNREALEDLDAEKRLEVVHGAGHLFMEPGALEEVAGLAREWFLEHLDAALDCEVF